MKIYESDGDNSCSPNLMTKPQHTNHIKKKHGFSRKFGTPHVQLDQVQVIDGNMVEVASEATQLMRWQVGGQMKVRGKQALWMRVMDMESTSSVSLCLLSAHERKRIIQKP